MAIHYNRYYVDIRKIEFCFYLWTGGHNILIQVISKLQGSIYSMILLVNTKSLMSRHWNHLITCSLMCPEYWLFLVGNLLSLLVGAPARLTRCKLGLPHSMMLVFQEQWSQEKLVEALIGLALEVTKWSLYCNCKPAQVQY